MNTAIANHYHQHSSIQKGLAKELLNDITVLSTTRILDIGCGDGVLSQTMAQSAYDGFVTAIDASSEMIELANSLLVRESLPNIQFIKSTFEQFQANEQYDLVTTFSSLYWINQPLENTFKQLKRVLSHHGRLIGFTFPKESEYWQPFLQMFSKREWAEIFQNTPCQHWQEGAIYQKLFKTAGFAISMFKSDILIANYPSIKAYQDYVLGWLFCLVPEVTLQEYFLNDLCNIVKSQYQTSAGEIAIPYTKLTFDLIADGT